LFWNWSKVHRMQDNGFKWSSLRKMFLMLRWISCKQWWNLMWV